MIPKWVDCKTCCNENTVLCMSCAVKYVTSPYINYAEKTDVVTKTSATGE
jgi:hypothetical protein